MLGRISPALAVSSPWIGSVKTYDSPGQVLWEHSPPLLLHVVCRPQGLRSAILLRLDWLHAPAGRAVPQHCGEAGEVRAAVP